MNKKYEFRVIVADPPWSLNDKLDGSPSLKRVKRGAAANYQTLTADQIAALPVQEIAASNSILALWVPSTLLSDGLKVMQAWGYKYKQIYVWVKTKKDAVLVDDCLSFGMGRLFRQTHEIALIGTKGSVTKLLKNKSQRSVSFGLNERRSKKPEHLQDSLELMFDCDEQTCLELFARRSRSGWTCLGNEINGQDIREELAQMIVENDNANDTV